MSEPKRESGIRETATDFEAQIVQWRDELLTSILRVALGVSVFAFGIALWQIWLGRVEASNAYVAGLIALVLAVGMVIPSNRRLSRITTLLAAFYIAGALGSLGGIVSLYGAGFVGFIACSALFLEVRGAVVSVIITIVHTALVAVALNQGWFESLIPPGGLDPTSPANWCRALAFDLAVAIVLAVCSISLLRRLRGNLSGSLKLVGKLEAEQKERERMKRHMIRAARMESLGRLAGGIAHDFNNALTVIGGEADYIVSEIGEGHPIGESAEIIRQATERAAALTRRLLLLGRNKELLRPTPQDLRTTINDMVRVSRRVLPGSIEVILEHCEAAVVKVDEPALHQALLNLVLNAADAMEQEGQLTLSCGARELKLGEASLAAGTYGFVTVADNGRGISEQDLGDIFDPFFAPSGQGSNSGLSLASTYGFATSSGGTIAVRSTLGEGTQFTLYFPLSNERVRDAVALLGSIAGIGKGKLALVAEDNLRVRAILWSALVDAGFEVLEAADGEAACSILKACDRTISLLVTDFMMPKKDGVHLARECHQAHPKVKIVMVTGYASSGASEQLRKIPNTVLLPKPFGRRELYRALESLV
ncbi:MAG: response regulator [Myxococcales bacterium]|nr:response regulator [Myxococcales bacterium]